MFAFSDIPKFFLAFFLVLPVISLIHEFGHVLFIWMMGGKRIRIRIGSGKTKFRWGMLEIRKYYFWYGSCSFENLNKNKRLSNIIIFTGGILLNTLTTIGMILLLNNGVLSTTILSYQFIYFSLYYIFFALLPMSYPDGSFSDGKIILDLLRNKQRSILDREYRVLENKRNKQWEVLNHKRKVIHVFSKEEEAFVKARKIAKKNRPSKLFGNWEGKDIEFDNYPRIPV